MFKREYLRIPKRGRLWTTNNSDDDDGDDDANQKRSNIEMIDLTDSPESVLATMTTASARRDQSTYIPSTLQSHSPRHSILPAFPTSIHDKQPPPLLLANVPLKRLDAVQRARRQPGVYPLVYSIDATKNDIPSYFRDHHQAFMNSLIAKYRVDASILDYNLQRFTECFQLFAKDLIRQHHTPADYFLLDEQQKQYAFEFYMQIDADLFFMKTCSFRRAKPRSRTETLFCVHEPESSYAFSPCQNCRLCVLHYNPNNRERAGPMIQFGSTKGHKFRNGYRALLNCPVDCQTNNLIYVMTCPCKRFEYIGETTQRLYDRLRYHRQQFNRMFHEFLLGEVNVLANQTYQKDKRTRTKDRMLLYRHAVRCSVAMQIFLNFNPIYWCFAPHRYAEVEVQNRINGTLPSSLILLDPVFPTSIASKDRAAILGTSTTRSDESVRSCMRNLPPVPNGYDFTLRQRIEQFQYFKQKHDVSHQQNPELALFNVAVVAVLPEDVSETVRRFVEALFITHTETNLNTSGRLVVCASDEDQSRPPPTYPCDLVVDLPPTSPMALEIQQLDREEWCLDLTFPHHRQYMTMDDDDLS